MKERPAEACQRERARLGGRVFAFPHILIFLSITLLAGALAGAEAPYAVTGTFQDGPGEFRGVWVNAKSIPTDAAGIREMVERLSYAHFNAIFLEVFYQGYTVYPSRVMVSRGMPPQMPLFDGLDPLDMVIKEAHARSIEVHAWLSMFYVGLNSPGPILTRYPEWAAINRNGEIGYRQGPNRFFWVCPMHAGVSEFYTDLACEIVGRYDVDGIHLDYVRFPDPAVADTCYSREHRAEFQRLYGIDLLDLDPYENPAEFKAWNKMRADSVTRLVGLISQRVHDLEPRVRVTAAVMPRGMPIELNPGFLQDWPLWLRSGYLDAVVPMTYSSRANEMKGLLVWSRYFAEGAPVPVYAGLQGFNLPGPQQLVDQIDAARQSGAPGVAIFAYPYLTDEYLAALRSGPFATGVLAHDGRERSAGQERKEPAGAALLAPTYYVQESPRRIVAVYVEEAPLVDGLLDDDAWNRADWQTDFELITGEGRAKEQTYVAACHDGQNLYIAFRMDDSNPGEIISSVTKRDGPVFYDDSIEIFLDPRHDHSFYYHFAANSLGTRYDSCSRRGPGWNADWRVAVTTGRAGWTLEVMIPVSQVTGEPPRPGDVFGINFNRTMPRLGEFSGWSFTPGTFHAPSFFGDLVFGE
ncbi:MAG TPA: family 10 glycosylhydrolase [Firmicutes bacterium]|nr:family 10 glycosylhydrolase [Bacillota bacterium]